MRKRYFGLFWIYSLNFIPIFLFLPLLSNLLIILINFLPFLVFILTIYLEKIRVGRDYQTVCPDLIPVSERKLETLNDRALLVWSPTKDIPDSKLEEYITVAKEKYGYNGEQALGMLFWHKHDLERAVLDLANFTPFPDEWTEEDKVLFEQAFHFHGKSFHRIRQMVSLLDCRA